MAKRRKLTKREKRLRKQKREWRLVITSYLLLKLSLHRPKRNKFVIAGSLFLIAGVLSLAPAFYFQYVQRSAQPGAPVNSVPVVLKSSAISGNPIHLSIPDLHLSLPIIPGHYDQATKEWTLTLDKVQFATVSPPPNNLSGNTYLYGHYRPEVFAPLHHLQKGQKVSVETDNGYRFFYTLSSIAETSPSDTSVFNYQGPPKLSIQTCSGLWFQNRQIFSFAFDHFEKV